jgi:SpoVK/Ycf46/Vps4 family AAA+-type ATPase
LFNEADAILGKRMYVSSSVDKMNNTIQNLLLQYLEDFNGIFFATTNSASFLDTAFDRRFLYKVEFNKPSYNVRLLILRNAFSEFADETLKLINDSFELTGGQILNIKKKLFISSLLQSNQTIEEVLFQLCKDEFSLKNNHTSNPIGFIKR